MRRGLAMSRLIAAVGVTAIGGGYAVLVASAVGRALELTLGRGVEALERIGGAL